VLVLLIERVTEVVVGLQRDPGAETIAVTIDSVADDVEAKRSAEIRLRE
jgi:hypothetical protein